MKRKDQKCQEEWTGVEGDTSLLLHSQDCTQPDGWDFVLRHFIKSQSGTVTTIQHHIDGGTVMANFRQVGIDRSVLRTACANLWKTYRYNQHYIGFLTGGVSQEDYEAAVEKYAAEPSSLHDELLRSAPRILSEILDDDDLDCHDLAVILNVSAEQLELALDKGESA